MEHVDCTKNGTKTLQTAWRAGAVALGTIVISANANSTKHFFVADGNARKRASQLSGYPNNRL